MTYIAFTDNAYVHGLLHWAAPARGSLRAMARRWWARRQERRSLGLLLAQNGELIERDLRDLGLDRGALEFEANKPFWRA